MAFRRFKIEHVFRLAQGEVGLSHFEGRSYVGRMRPRILGQTVRLFVAEQAQRPASASPVESTRSGQPGPSGPADCLRGPVVQSRWKEIQSRSSGYKIGNSA